MIGIDLGTTHSLIAYWDESCSTPKIINNILGSAITPSVVSILDNDEFMVGAAAKNRLLSHPQSSAATFKRKMASTKEYQLGPHKLSAVELSSMVLKQLKEDAQRHLHSPITQAVISVPAYFNDAQRKATMQAANMAGIEVERLINEPTAAAIAYGLHERVDDSSFLVVDLGGGTLDTSLLEIYEGVIEVHASAGDNFLGGEDFTKVIIDDFCQQHQLAITALTAQQRSNLYARCNELKEALTTSQQSSFKVEIGDKSMPYQISRADFEQLCGTLLQRIRTPIERVLRDSKMAVGDIDEVILVGGATRMPCVRKLIGTLLRRLPASHIDPDRVVALGAAVQSALHHRNDALKDIILTDVCPYTLGVEVAIEKAADRFTDGHFMPIIERNATIPKSRQETLITLYDNQQYVKCSIYQGESRLTRNNIKLGELSIEVPKRKAGESFVDVRFTYTNDGILEVIVTSPLNGKEDRVIINNSNHSLSDEQLRQRLAQLEKIKLHPSDDYPNTFLLSQLEKLYEQALGDERQYIAYLTQQFERVLDSQDHDLVKQHREELSIEVEQLMKKGSLL